MKKAITVLFAAIAINTASAQDSAPFQKGTNVVSAGLGLGGSFGISNYGSQTPGISVQYERGIWEVGGPGIISLGAYIGMKSYKYEYSQAGYYPLYIPYTISEKWNWTIIGVRGAYHYNGLESDVWDLYGGIMISEYILSYKYTNNDPNDNYHLNLNGYYGNILRATAFVGGRYFFSKNFAAYGELGYGVSNLSLGVSLKF